MGMEVEAVVAAPVEGYRSGLGAAARQDFGSPIDRTDVAVVEVSEPDGSYYVTRGWMKMDTTQFDQAVKRYGSERADDLYRVMFAEYKRLALINTGSYKLDDVRYYAVNAARQFGLRFEEIQGSTDLSRKLLHEPWSSEEFVIREPGSTTELTDFLG